MAGDGPTRTHNPGYAVVTTPCHSSIGCEEHGARLMPQMQVCRLECQALTLLEFHLEHGVTYGKVLPE